MRYKRMGRNGTYRLRLPLLDGGVHAADSTAIADNELADACNLHMKQNALVTRPALRFVNHDLADVGVPVVSGKGSRHQQDMICREPFEMDGKWCVALLAAASYSIGDGAYTAHARILIVNMDGAVEHTYSMPDMDPLARSMVLVPVDESKQNVPFFVYHNRHVYRPNGDVMECIPDEELYAPLVMINGTGTGGTAKANGVMYEGFNALTRRYRAQFTTMGVNNTVEQFCMPTELDESAPVTVEVTMPDGVYTATLQNVKAGPVPFRKPDGTEDETHNLRATESGIITIQYSFGASSVSGNVTVTATRNNDMNGIFGATVGTWFGGTNNRLGGTRLFLSGFGKYDQDKAKVVWSDVNNPLYFPENNYMHVGNLSERVTALDKQEDMLVIFKEREMYYTTYVQGEIDEQAIAEGTNVDVTAVQAYFTATQLSPYIGCDCPQTVVSCRNRLVWMCADGRVYTLASANQYSERNVREIGQKIRPRILAETNEAIRKTAYAADVDGEYWLQCGKTAFTFRYDASGFVNLNSYASSSNASKAIAWFIHRFDGFDDDTAIAIVSDGAAKALVIGTKDVKSEGGTPLYTHARFVHTLSDGDCDRFGTVKYMRGIACVEGEERPICSSLKTKAYTFGGTALCRMKGLWLTATANRLRIGTEADGKEEWLPVFLDSEMMHTHFLPLGIKRCHRLALMLETENPVAVTETEWLYTPFGYVK